MFSFYFPPKHWAFKGSYFKALSLQLQETETLKDDVYPFYLCGCRNFQMRAGMREWDFSRWGKVAPLMRRCRSTPSPGGVDQVSRDDRPKYCLKFLILWMGWCRRGVTQRCPVSPCPNATSVPSTIIRRPTTCSGINMPKPRGLRY